jgi:tetratricopeptide (TPR) repeat protein
MQITKTHKIIISAVILVILLGIYIVFDRKSKKEQDQFKNTEQFSTTTIPGTNIQINTQGGGYKIEQVPIDEGRKIPQPIPDLARKTIFSNNSSLTVETKNVLEKKIIDLQLQLSKNPGYFEAWLDLGIYQKSAGDYEGTIISWTYASKLYPASYLPLGNLGNLYAYFLKDNGMAEVYYKQAISKGPTQPYLYTQLAEIYRDIFKDNTKALDIINQGLSQIPNDPNLLQLKASLTK